MKALRLFVGRLSHFLPTRPIPTTSTPPPTSSTIAALCNEGHLNEAVHALHNNIHDIVDSSTYAHLLQRCIQKKALHHAKRIHALILNLNQLRFNQDVFLHNTVLQMYVKCGRPIDARGVFDGMIDRDVFSWNFMIAGYRNQGLSEEALELFHQMQRNGNGVQPNEFIFASVVPACANWASLEEGVDIHRNIIRSGFHCDVIIANALIDMYAKLGSIEKARVLFDKMPRRDTISWTAMITGYAQNGLHEEALNVFEGMQRSGVVPNEFTFASVVALCASSASLEECVDIHRKLIKNGIQCDVVIANVLIDMYAEFGNMHKARVLFEKTADRNMFSWTTLIAGYAQNGFLDEAVKLFKEIPQRDTISWNAMITGYAQNGHGLEALKCFQKMQLNSFRPNSITIASILAVCATFAALKWGMDIHGQIIRCAFFSYVFVITALIDMYAKCGSIKMARVLFDKMHYKQIISWTAMIAGYARNGCSKEAIKLFEEMEHLGLNPNYVTFISVLSACSHAGLVKEGYQYFKSMNDYYRITPLMEHYTCMVDLLGRAGRLDEAKDFINSMPIKPDAALWTCLLGACRIHNNLKLAEFVAEHLIELDPQNSVPYVLLSNIYAVSGRWNQIENIRKMMKDRGIQKLPGCSWIVVNEQVHTFFVYEK